MNETENKREYEMSFLLTPEVAEDKLDFETAELKKLISENDGEAIQINLLEKKQLAYPVKKQNQAYLGIVYFNINSDGLDKMKNVLALNPKFLRFLILNKPIKLNKPVKSRIEPIMKIPEILPRTEKTTEIPNESFDKKLESILNG